MAWSHAVTIHGNWEGVTFPGSKSTARWRREHTGRYTETCAAAIVAFSKRLALIQAGHLEELLALVTHLVLS